MMDSTRAVRREQLFRDDASQADGDGRRAAADGSDDAAAAAARAALDAYMKEALGLQFAVEAAPPRTAPPRPSSKPAPEPRHDDAADDGGDDSDNSDHSDHSDHNARPLDNSADGYAAPQPAAEEFQFRLFSSSSRAPATAKAGAAAGATDAAAAGTAPAPVIVLDVAGDGDGASLGPGGLLSAPRPLSYYLLGEPTGAERARYQQIAVSGADIIAGADPAVRNAWGLEVPWRACTVVRVADKAAMRALLRNALAPGQQLPASLPAALAQAVNALPAWAAGAAPVTGGAGDSSGGTPDDAAALHGRAKHCRPGKRARIILRRRAQARREKEVAAAAATKAKEEHLSEKRKRLNRVKKLRRREKKRATKTGGGEGDGGGDGDDHDASEDGEGEDDDGE